MSIKMTSKGNWSKTHMWLKRDRDARRRNILERYGIIGVRLLEANTPVDTGLTSISWYYQIRDDGDRSELYFCNSNVNDGVPIAIILQYGHGTATGGWVEGRDYINPAMQPLFNDLADSMWREVTET